jgi:hypothetical protein
MPLGPWFFGEGTHFANRNRGKLNAPPAAQKARRKDGLFAILTSVLLQFGEIPQCSISPN